MREKFQLLCGIGDKYNNINSETIKPNDKSKQIKK